MSARARVEFDVGRNLVSIDLTDGPRLVDFRDVQTLLLQEGVEAPADHTPLRLPEDAARALYEALSRYFGGAPDMVTVRSDLLHERGRVDKLIDNLIKERA